MPFNEEAAQEEIQRKQCLKLPEILDFHNQFVWNAFNWILGVSNRQYCVNAELRRLENLMKQYLKHLGTGKRGEFAPRVNQVKQVVR